MSSKLLFWIISDVIPDPFHIHLFWSWVEVCVGRVSGKVRISTLLFSDSLSYTYLLYTQMYGPWSDSSDVFRISVNSFSVVTSQRLSLFSLDVTLRVSCVCSQVYVKKFHIVIFIACITDICIMDWYLHNNSLLYYNTTFLVEKQVGYQYTNHIYTNHLYVCAHLYVYMSHPGIQYGQPSSKDATGCSTESEWRYPRYHCPWLS